MREVEKLRTEVERLKPAEVFLNILCTVCGKPLANTWKREWIERIFRDRGARTRNASRLRRANSSSGRFSTRRYLGN